MNCFSPLAVRNNESSHQRVFWLGDDYNNRDNDDDDVHDDNDMNSIDTITKESFNSGLVLGTKNSSWDRNNDSDNNVTSNDNNDKNLTTTTNNATTNNVSSSTILATTPIVFEIGGIIGLKSLLEHQQTQRALPVKGQSSKRTDTTDDNDNGTSTALSSTNHIVDSVLNTIGTINKSLLVLSSSIKINPYCIVKWNENEIHRTAIIYNDENPIWTIRTKSICLVPIPDHYWENESTNNDKTDEKNSTNDLKLDQLSIEVYHDRICLGIVTILAVDIPKLCTSQRLEYEIQPTTFFAKSSRHIIQQASKSNLQQSSTVSNDSSSQSNLRRRHQQPIRESIVRKSVTAPLKDLLKSASILSFRCRLATDDDIQFIHCAVLLNKTISPNNNTKNSPKEQSKHALIASDINFANVQYQSIQENFRSKRKLIIDDPLKDIGVSGENPKDKEIAPIGANSSTPTNQTQQQQQQQQRKQVLFRVKPGPDPTRDRKDTEWMTTEQIDNEALKPSYYWITISDGTCGKLFIEIIGCNNLTNMDAIQNLSIVNGNKNDIFVAILYEDTLIRTNVIWDCNHPKWMPWTTRSFVFNVHHPSSLLMLGVFDYDDLTSIDYHDPIGRVVIDICNFEPNISYLLHYKLQHDPRSSNTDSSDTNSIKERGTITIRLRIEFNDPIEAKKISIATPPPSNYIINVNNEKSYQVVRYITHGYINMDEASIDTIQLYGREFLSYWQSYCYVLDIIFETLLWRGQITVSFNRAATKQPNESSRKWKLWFPIHSFMLFVAANLLLEYPGYIIPITLYSIAWILLSINYYASRNVNPWKRVKPSEELFVQIVLGRNLYKPISNIQPNEGYAESIRMEKLDLIKCKRMSRLIQGIMYFMLKVYRIYSKTGDLAITITTNRKEWHLFADRLYYIHMLLKYVCTYARRFRNFINWKSYYTFVFTTKVIIVASLWLVLPMNAILYWVSRFFVWIFLSPIMKIVDAAWVQSWYCTRDQLLENIDSADSIDSIDLGLPDFDSILESELFLRLVQAGRINSEYLCKLKDIRETLFGKYSEVVPCKDNSMTPCFPLPQSSASCIKLDKARELPKVEDDDQTMNHISGQSLYGNIVPTQSNANVQKDASTTNGFSKDRGIPDVTSKKN